MDQWAKILKMAKKSGNRNLMFVVIGIIAVILFIRYSGLVSFDEPDKAANSADMSVHFIDVGQGDSTLVVCNGEAMLIDAGERDCGKIVGEYLDSLKIDTLKYVIGTHPHSDHIGGLAYIISNYDVENVILPKIPDDLVPTTSVYEKLLAAISDKGLKIRAARDETLEVGGCEVKVFAPTGEYTNLNNYSVSVKLTHGKNTFLLTGDCETDAEKALVNRHGGELKAKVLKLGHHGSSTSSSVELLDAVDPKYAVICCGADNKYGHPHRETLEKMADYSISVLRTDTSGTIIFESDGEGLNVVDTSGKSLLK